MKAEDLIPDVIYISHGVEDFSNACINIVRELAGDCHDIEWDSDIVTLKGDERKVVRRLMPSAKSYVGPAHVNVPGSAINENLDRRLADLRNRDNADYVISGIWHSHGGFGASFSDTDYSDFSSEGPRIARDNVVFDRVLPFELFKGQTEIVFDGRRSMVKSNVDTDPTIVDTYPSIDAAAEILGISPDQLSPDILDRLHLSFLRQHYENVTVGIALAVVVDARKQDPFGIIGYHLQQSVSGPVEGYWRTKKVKVESVSVENDMTFRTETLEAMLRRSLHIGQHFPVRSMRSPHERYPAERGVEAGTAPQERVERAQQYLPLATQFVYAAASYISKVGTDERRYAPYLTRILDRLYTSSDDLCIIVAGLGPLSTDDHKLTRPIPYGALISHVSTLLARGNTADSAFIRQFGAGTTMEQQNQVLEKYVEAVMQNGPSK